MYRKFDEIWTVVSEIGKQTDKQTDEHTERLNTISTPGAKYWNVLSNSTIDAIFAITMWFFLYLYRYICMKNNSETHPGDFYDIFIRGAQWRQSNLLREFSENRITQQRHVSKHLVNAVANIDETKTHGIHQSTETVVVSCVFFLNVVLRAAADAEKNMSSMLDLSLASDTVDHVDVLLDVLQHGFAVDGHALDCYAPIIATIIQFSVQLANYQLLYQSAKFTSKLCSLISWIHSIPSRLHQCDWKASNRSSHRTFWPQNKWVSMTDSSWNISRTS